MTQAKVASQLHDNTLSCFSSFIEIKGITIANYSKIILTCPMLSAPPPQGESHKIRDLSFSFVAIHIYYKNE